MQILHQISGLMLWPRQVNDDLSVHRIRFSTRNKQGSVTMDNWFVLDRAYDGIVLHFFTQVCQDILQILDF